MACSRFCVVYYFCDQSNAAIPNTWVYEEEGQLFAYWYVGKKARGAAVEKRFTPDPADETKWQSLLCKIKCKNSKIL